MTVDGGLLDTAELADLLAAVATATLGLAHEPASVRGKQLAVLSAVLGDVAGRLGSDPPAGRDELAERLAAGDDTTALAIARRLIGAELARTEPLDWALFT